MAETSRKTRADKGYVRLKERDRDGMLFLGEQSGVRRDQMARVLGRRAERATKKPGEVGSTTAQGIIERWCAIGWVQAVSIYKNQPDWLYVTEKGLRALGLPYNPWTPPQSGYLLEHKFWINEVRLLLEEVYPQGRWVSERHIRHYRTLTHYPDAEFYPPQITTAIAIEVERSLKDSERLERILPWLVAHYENTWYFAVQHEVLVRVRAKRAALSPAQQERLFLSHYDEPHQHWQTNLGQAPRRSVPVQPDQERIEHEPIRAERPSVSEVLQEIADEWVPPSGDQFGSKRLPLLSPAWMPQTFEAAVAVAIRLLTDSDQAVLRNMQGFAHSEQLGEWSQRLQEQLGLQVWGDNWYGADQNKTLWLACGRRSPAEIVFHLMEEVWRQFQPPPVPRHSRQLIRAESLPLLPRTEWPSTLEEATYQARSLLSPFEVIWLHAHEHTLWRDEKFPREGWMDNLFDQFGLRPPQRKGAQAWNEVLWRAADTTGKPPEEQQLRVKLFLWKVIAQVTKQIQQEAKEAQAATQPEEPPPEEWFFPDQGDPSSGVPQDVSWHRQAPLRLFGGVGMLAGLGMLGLGWEPLGILFLLLGIGVFALGVLARQSRNGSMRH
jgi:hypothetical protein